jgi:Family of unknown function (DUF6491)
MRLVLPILALAAAAMPADAAPDAPAPRAEEARIPFVGFGSIRSFRTAGDDVLYLQDMRRRWYRAELSGPCHGIEAALRIGVDTRFSSTLDNSGTLIVDGRRCPIHSLVPSEEPPRRPRN